MTDFKLQVVNALARALFDFSEQDFPDGISGSLCTYDGAELPLPEDSATLLLTDSTELVRSLSWNKPERLHIVFIGSLDDSAGYEDSLEDIWCPAEGAAGLRRRCLRLMKTLKGEYDLWFYQNALLTTINSVPDMLWYKRIDGIHMLVNNAFTEIVHKPKSDIHGKDHFDIWDVPRPAGGSASFACAESEEITISSGKLYICDEAVKTREGMKQFTTYKSPLYDMFGTVFGTVGIGHDVTSLSNLGNQLSILVENLPFPISVFDPDWKPVRMNSAFSDLAGVAAEEELAGFDYRAWKAGLLRPVGDRSEDSARHAASREYQLNLNGRTRLFNVTELEIRNYFGDVTGYFSMMEDITYRRAYEQSILKAANTDTLTGLYNRRYFDNFVHGNTGKPFHLLYMDLDRFKQINDVHGHNVGDGVLVKVAELLREFFPHMVIARLGGDEFVVVDEDHDRAFIDRRCAEFEAAVTEALREYGQDASISIGVARADGSAEDIDRVLRESDANMYAAKRRRHDAR